MNVLVETNGELRCPDTLELLGHWYRVEGSCKKYIILNEEGEKRNGK